MTALDQARSLLARAKEQKAARLREAEEESAAVRTVPAPRTTETRVQQALDTATVERALPTLPAVSDLLSGSLKGGSVYSVRGSTALVMAMMAGPSAEGAWCGVVGLPSFGAEAAREFGVDLERLVLVPDPERDWLSVVAALVDALTVVVVRPPGEVTPGEASRLAARLRTRGAMLIAVGSWPGSEARLEVQGNVWTGLGAGEGYLAGRQATVAVTGRGASRQHQLWLPAVDGSIRSVRPIDLVQPGDPGRAVESGRAVDSGRPGDLGRAVDSGWPLDAGRPVDERWEAVG
ncbi:hypothetical protein EV138_0175 [Kribbella voronezhensis]|uniref:Protein RecA n=1 Tax=Kribbella voronezhensis TaxID=2512212 RepID=A0A4R7T4C2_9ACTN|nr:hypothetical protein [Kribbella voronezhensis]TDU86661.1 hypothetical protein EV138_0175 [Kribbella voronezhensis]